ncbi:hypothetical protein [Candidatus Cardinium hertigii]|uniref:Uncharacterized protein n=1 Tax=Candidatus Cardinium hertigii TaxID=247481 RepID=A0A2Z3LDY3_9BACT|nr:hypothetical protein [Candidatus Cardinium hertigii]AWN81956.1 hypothetical protein DK880_00642 [Candidatus Cardinium hertigii]
MEAVRDCYNGYKTGNLIRYNPWSSVSCINKAGRFDLYWINTGNNDLIKQLILSSNDSIKGQIEQLMQGAALTASIDKHLAFDLLDRSKTALWSLLLFADYLTWEKSSLSRSSDLYD